MSHMVQGRSATSFLHVPYLATGTSSLVYEEPPHDAQLWRLLDELARVPSKGRVLFAPPLANQNRHWAEFGNFVRQAAAYWKGARTIEGSSAGLVYYYSAMNLAKAELMIFTPKVVFNRKITHGLSFDPTSGKGPRVDNVTVRDGVFNALYTRRTGRVLPAGTRLRIKSLLANIPEVGMELEESGPTPSKVVFALHTVLASATEAWNAVYVPVPRFLGDPREPATRHFLKAFTEIEKPRNHRTLFALSSRMANQGRYYESIATHSDSGQPNIMAAIANLGSATSPYSSGPDFSTNDFVLTPSLVKSSDMPMPPALARYALMFYVSSLVRYRPSILDPVRHPETAWLIDSFMSQSPMALLLEAAQGIARRSISYETGGLRA